MSEKQEMLDEQKGLCWICEKPMHGLSDATYDHIIPASRGGTWDRWNLKLAHRLCNNRRGSAPAEAWDTWSKDVAQGLSAEPEKLMPFTYEWLCEYQRRQALRKAKP